MVIGSVIGSIWATRKEDGLTGLKLLKVKIEAENQTVVAVDRIGAGVGDQVIVTRGNPASLFLDTQVPIDALIIGIIDPEDQKG